MGGRHRWFEVLLIMSQEYEEFGATLISSAYKEWEEFPSYLHILKLPFILDYKEKVSHKASIFPALRKFSIHLGGSAAVLMC